MTKQHTDLKGDTPLRHCAFVRKQLSKTDSKYEVAALGNLQAFFTLRLSPFCMSEIILKIQRQQQYFVLSRLGERHIYYEEDKILKKRVWR